MPQLAKQSPHRPAALAPANGQPIADGSLGIVSASTLRRQWMKVLLYGRHRVGKSTLSAQWPKPLLAIACEPRENGGADSLIGMEGVDVAVIAMKPLPMETMRGTEKLDHLLTRFETIVQQTGKCPYQSMTVDVTALQDIVLAEIMGWDTTDQILKRPTKGGGGGPGRPQFMERADGCIKLFRRFKDLPCNTIFVGQEKDHNPPRDEDGNPISGKMVTSAQEKSFMSVYLGEATATWLQNACQFVCQLYMDVETKEVVTQVKIGNETRNDVMIMPTGKFTRRLRCSYHPNYAAGITAPGIDCTPEYIEAATPQQMYEALVKVSQGLKVREGKYL